MATQQEPMRYYLVAQNRGDELVIGVEGRSQLLIKSASEILSNAEMLQGFSPAQAALIGVIAGMEGAPKCTKYDLNIS